MRSVRPQGRERPASGPDAASRPLVSVIVVNHNRAQLLTECLGSLQSQDYPRLEILAVDNASSDDSRQAVQSLGDRRIRLVALSENRGFAGGNNAGFRQAGGEYLALLNNDAQADPGWVSALVDALEGSPSSGMAASKILFQGTRIIDKAGHLIHPDGQNRGRGTGETDQGQFDESEEALFPDGCAALYRRRLIEQTGGFDEDFFAYADDADLGLRARWLGWGCIYVPNALVHHRHSSTSGRFSPRKIYWVERNRHWLAVKNLPLPLLLISPLHTANRWAWNLWAAIRGRGAAGSFRREASSVQLARVVLRAAWDGLKGTPRMWRKRTQLRRRRQLSNRCFMQLLKRFRISARELAFKEFEE